MAWFIESIGAPNPQNGYSIFHFHRFIISHYIDENNNLHENEPIFLESNCKRISFCKKCGAKKVDIYIKN